MSLAKDNIWKLLAPLVVMGVMFLIPVPDGMPPQAWHYFAVFVAMIVGMILSQFRQQRSVLLRLLFALLAVITCSLMPKN